MAIQGPMTWFNKALERVNAAEMAADTFKAILVTASQSFDEDFVGSSGEARYADITAELATASGYTAGGLAITSPAIALVSGSVRWTSDDVLWTLSGTIAFRWILFFNDSSANDDLLCFADMNTDGATNISAVAGPLGFAHGANGWLKWEQP